MKNIWFAWLILATQWAGAQDLLQPDAKGAGLKDFYLSLHVEEGWIAGSHVDWETGVADRPDATTAIHTHCSAFVAAACKRLNIYILRPPEHGEVLLANAQYDWLVTPDAVKAGWRPLSGDHLYEQAQSMANQGRVVVALCRNPDPHKPGHIALVTPARVTDVELQDAGPMVIMAGTHNYNRISLKNGFRTHLSGWPENSVLFYYNTHTL
jgi:hypothetical protein